MYVMPIDNVLIATDTDEPDGAAIAAGLELAARHGANVVVLGVVERIERVAELPGDVVPAGDSMKPSLQQRRETLERVVASAAGPHFAIHVEVVTGVRSAEIVRAAVARAASVIVYPVRLSAGGECTGDDWQLLRRAPVPVWIMRHASAFPPRRIVVALDVLGPPEEAPLNQALLSLAVRIARPWGAAVDVISAWRLDGERLLSQSRHLRLDRAELHSVLDDVAERARAGQDELRTWLTRINPAAEGLLSWRLERGDPHTVLSRFAADRGVDLLMMGTLGRSATPGLPIRSTAESVLSQVGCSVLTLRPSPFVAPMM